MERLKALSDMIKLLPEVGRRIRRTSHTEKHTSNIMSLRMMINHMLYNKCNMFNLSNKLVVIYRDILIIFSLLQQTKSP